MKKLLTSVFLLLALGLGQSLRAQEFDTAIGVRLGYPLALSVKKFVNDNHALEFYVGTRGYWTSSWRNFNLSGAYLIHEDFGIDDLDGFGFYYGGGATLFLWTFGFENINFNIGVQGYGGLYYVLELDDRLVEFTLDWVPTLILGQRYWYNNRFRGDHGTIGIRFSLD